MITIACFFDPKSTVHMNTGGATLPRYCFSDLPQKRPQLSQKTLSMPNCTAFRLCLHPNGQLGWGQNPVDSPKVIFLTFPPLEFTQCPANCPSVYTFSDLLPHKRQVWFDILLTGLEFNISSHANPHTPLSHTPDCWWRLSLSSKTPIISKHLTWF
jgi:hypothetical protein